MTLVVFSYQTSIMREQQRMSVLPYLSMMNEGTGSDNYKLILKNDGIGPAFIESVIVAYEGKEYETDLPRFLAKHSEVLDSLTNIYHSNIIPGQLIPAGLVIPILGAKDSKSNSEKLHEIIKNFDCTLKIIYKSIYDERWLLDSNSAFPQKLE